MGLAAHLGQGFISPQLKHGVSLAKPGLELLAAPPDGLGAGTQICLKLAGRPLGLYGGIEVPAGYEVVEAQNIGQEAIAVGLGETVSQGEARGGLPAFAPGR